MGRAVEGDDPRRRGPRQAGEDGLPGQRTLDETGGERGEDRVEGGQAPNVSAVDSRAGPVAAVRLGRGPAHRGPADLAVLRVAVLVAVPGRDPGLGLHAGHVGGLPGHHAAADRRGTDLRTDRQREDGHRRAHRRDPGAAPADGRRGPALRLPGGQLRALTIPNRRAVRRPRSRSRRPIWCPRDANLLPAYDSFAELADACRTWCDTVNSRRHRATGQIPADRLDIERTTLHVLPDRAPRARAGRGRLVGSDRTISFNSVRYSTPPGYTGVQGVVPGGRRGTVHHRPHQLR